MPKIKNKLSVLFLFSFVFFCFSSCKMKSEQKSLTSRFDVIDALISQNQTDSAIKLLKKLEKKAHDSWSCIGVFKRYSLLGEKTLAEKMILKSLKKNPENLELLVVYSDFLMKDNRLPEAKNYAEKLCDTKYASVYSEIILKLAMSAENYSQDDFYDSSEFYQIYYDAYKITKNAVWLKNCAIFDLANGFYEKAALFDPKIYADIDDAFFWATVLYDAKKYYASLDALEKSKKFLNNYQNKEKFKTTIVMQAALESDLFMSLSDMQNSEKARQTVILNIDNLKIKNDDEKFLPAIFTNSAIWAENQGNSEKCADFLFYAVNRWENYVPALILYADFAYKSSLERKEDAQIAALRKAGLSTLEMERWDNRRKIPVSDALWRIEKSLKATNDPYLEIVKLDLKYKTNPDLSEKEKNGDLWYLLEKKYESAQADDFLLTQYALHSLLQSNQKDDARRVFYNYAAKSAGFSAERDFWEQFTEKIDDIELPLCEFAGYFAAEDRLTDVALRIYEHCVYENSELLESGVISQNVSTSACMNLADIYFSTGKKDKALKLYGIISGRENKNSARSEIFYRISKIYAAQNDIKNALRLAEYAYSLYPQNVKASVLKDKLLAAQKER